MTRKEKKEEALRWKAIIDARKPNPELTPEQQEALDKKRLADNNHRRKLSDKAKNRKGWEDMIGKKHIPKGWDFDKWC